MGYTVPTSPFIPFHGHAGFLLLAVSMLIREHTGAGERARNSLILSLDGVPSLIPTPGCLGLPINLVWNRITDQGRYSLIEWRLSLAWE